MNKKKVLMIILLIIFIAVIGIMLLDINDKSVAKLEEISQNTNNKNSDSTNTTDVDGIVRRITEKVEADNNNLIEITDNYFIQQTNDVYYNLDDYLGKTVKMQGLIYSYKETNGDICYAVVRNTPGCCGADGLAGLDIRYDGEYPQKDTWVEVVGVVGKETVYNDEIPVIQVTSLIETETGKSFVTN